MKLSRAVTQWCQEIRVHKAAVTVSSYESDLTGFVGHVRFNSILSFTTENLKTWFLSQSEQGLKPSTLHRRMASVGMFGAWGVEQGLWPRNPMAGLDRIRRPKHLPRPFSRDECDALMALQLEGDPRVIRALLFFTGLRVTPVCMLKVGDVSLNPPQLRAWVKGAKVQVIQMHPVLATLVGEHLRAANRKLYEPLVTQSSGRRYTRTLIEKMTRGWGTSIGLPNCLPHRFRHSFGTRLIEETGDLRMVKDALGHEDISSTVVYTEVTDEKLRQGIARLPWTRA